MKKGEAMELRTDISRRRLGAAILFIAAGILAGSLTACATGSLTADLRSYRHYSSEFKNYDSESEMPVSYDGFYNGVKDRGGIHYREYRFDGLLRGDEPRHLVILVPVEGSDSGGRAIVTESALIGDDQEKERARLFVTWESFWVPHCWADYYSESPVTRIKRDYALFFQDEGFGLHALIAHFLHSDPEADPPGVYFVREMSSDGDPVWDFALADVELDWEVRSRIAYCFFHVFYVFTVPWDIVTTPLIFPFFVMHGA